MPIDVLQERIRTLKNPIILSLELTQDLIPQFILDGSSSIAEGYNTYCRSILDALKGLIPGVKFSLVSFLALGPEGLSILPSLMAYAKALGYYVILDGIPDSWGELGQAMALSVFGENAIYPADGAVLNGYCGVDAISPWLSWCKEGHKSLFILTKSPNRSSVEVQDLFLGGRLVHTAIADLVGHWGWDGKSFGSYTSVGAVVGAPYPESIKTLRANYSRMFLLVTGVDSNRASPKKCTHAFDRFGHGAAVCAGSYILGAWKADGSDGRDYQEKAVEAARKLLKNLTRYITIL